MTGYDKLRDTVTEAAFIAIDASTVKEVVEAIFNAITSAGIPIEDLANGKVVPVPKEAIEMLLKALDERWLVRSIEHDSDPSWAIKSLPYVNALSSLAAALPAAPKEPTDG